MPLSIKVNLRVTGHCNQGGRKYMEDMFSVAYQQTSDDRDLEYAFFGIFDGHGGGEAAKFAKDHLMDIIVKQKNFWSDKDEDVLRAIRDGYVNTHYAMWRELDKWPRTASGLPSTAGTTASIAFIRKGKIYIGHVGDSGIVLGYQDNEGDPQWKAKPLTRDHKPESGPEMTRIQESGGKVVSKSGVPRVVWNRPRIGHKGPVRRSTHIDEIPFLAVARSLGDLWSYNSELDTFVVSPEPDVKVIKVDVKSHRCLIFGTDGLWNMLSPQAAVSIVQAAEKHNEKHFIASQQTGNVLQSENQMWINPSKSLVDRALERWSSTRLRADNTSVVTLMIDPPGPSRLEFLLNRSKNNLSTNSLPNCSPIYRSPSSNCNHSNPNLEKTSTKDFYYHSQVNTSDTKLLDNNYCQNQPFLQSVSSPLTVNDKLVSNNPNEKNSDLPLNSNINRIAHSFKKQQKPTPVVNTIANSDDTMNYSNSENIQVAEVSSSNITISDASINKSTSSNNSNVNILSSAEDNDKTKEKINCNIQSQLQPPLEKITDNTESFCDQTTLSDDDDDDDNNIGLGLVRQNAFSSAFSDFNLFKSKIPLATTPTTINSTANTTLINNKNTNPVTNNITTVAPTVSGSQDINETYRDENIKNNTSASCMKKFEKQKEIVIISNNSNEANMAHLNGATLKIKRREISLRSNITTRVNSKTVHKAIVSTATKRRHSSTFDITPNDVICNIVHQQQEPCLKRRTRSEDRKCLARNENNPNNQKQVKQQLNGRLRWINSCSNMKNRNITTAKSYSTGGVENNILEKNILLSTATTIATPATPSNSASSSSSTSFQRRSLEKKATPMKNTRRGPVNYVINNGNTNGGCNGVGCSGRLAQLRSNFTLKDWDQMKSNRKSMTGSYSKEDHRLKLNCMIVGNGNNTSNSVSNSSPPQRWLRSDTIAATPIKTLRSRNVDIAGHTIPPQLAHQYGIVKQNRHSLNTKLNKLSSATSKIISKTSMQLTTSKLIKPNNGMNHGNNASSLALSNSVSVIAKRVKSSPYNSNTRSRLGTRSRLKRLSK